LSLREHNTDHINNILYKYIQNNHNPLERKSKKWYRNNIDYHIVIDFSNSINYHHLNHFAKTLDTKNKHISIRMHRSLGASLKQLTRFFNAQKTLSFSLENNMVKTYIHSNDCEPINTKPLSFPSLLPINAFKQNNSMNWKNNCFTSGFVSNNSPDNYPTESLKNIPTPSSSIFFKRKSEQHLNSGNVFPPLSHLSTAFFHPLKVDSSSYSNSDFKDLLNFAYGSSSSPPTSPNTNTDSSTALEQFAVLHQLSIHVFSSSFFYYSLH
jgi:hypothetical protein